MINPPLRTSGNVLFLILIAVALFAALAYAVTTSNRSSGQGISYEKANANAAAIIQYSTALRAAIMKLRASGNCTENSLDFGNVNFKAQDDSPLNIANPSAPSNQSCHIYSAVGGNMVAVIAPVASLVLPYAGSWYAGHTAIRVGQIKGIGTDGVAGLASANDLFAQVNGINRETCRAINNILGIPNPGGEPPIWTVTGSSTRYLSGSFNSTYIGEFGDATPSGQPQFCIQGAAGSSTYFSVLIER